jgi:hypothetical protein
MTPASAISRMDRAVGDSTGRVSLTVSRRETQVRRTSAGTPLW